MWILWSPNSSVMWPHQKTLHLTGNQDSGVYGQAFHKQMHVVVACPLELWPAQSAPCMHTDATAFWGPFEQLHVASEVPLKRWSLTNWLVWTSLERLADILNLFVRHTSTASITLHYAASFQKLTVPCFYPLGIWCCFRVNTTKPPLRHNNGFEICIPKHSLCLLMNWCHLWLDGQNATMQMRYMLEKYQATAWIPSVPSGKSDLKKKYILLFIKPSQK